MTPFDLIIWSGAITLAVSSACFAVVLVVRTVEWVRE